MLVITGVFENERFIPDKQVEIPQKKKAVLTFEDETSHDTEIARKLATFRQLTEEVKKSNKTDPLPPEFDAILSQRVQFKEINV